MPLSNIIIVLIVVGILLWLINNYVPMGRRLRSLFNIVILGVVVIWLLQAFGLVGAIGGLRFDRWIKVEAVDPLRRAEGFLRRAASAF